VAALGLMIGTVATLLSGRRVIQLLVVLAIPIAGIISRKLQTRDRPPRKVRIVRSVLGIAIGGAVAVAVFKIDLMSYVRLLQEGFFGADDGAIRTQQGAALLEHWLRSPLFGHGFGSIVPGLIRSDERPWNFELQYHLYLMQIGIVGVLLLLLAVHRCVREVRTRSATADREMWLLYVGSCTAAALMLIANGTNPYLQALGHQWPLFLPAIVASVHYRETLKEKSRTPVGSSSRALRKPMKTS
jgi:hypothetical protein